MGLMEAIKVAQMLLTDNNVLKLVTQLHIFYLYCLGYPKAVFWASIIFATNKLFTRLSIQQLSSTTIQLPCTRLPMIPIASDCMHNIICNFQDDLNFVYYWSPTWNLLRKTAFIQFDNISTGTTNYVLNGSYRNKKANIYQRSGDYCCFQYVLVQPL